MTNPNIPPEIADATPAPAPVRMVNIRAATLEQLHAAVACASEANYTSSADMRIRWGLSEGRCVIEEVQRLCYDALHALESENQEVTEQVRVSRQDQPRPEAQEQEDQAMTKLTKAERADILSASSADGYYAHDISRLCADLDAAEAERDEIKTALGVMGATRERALEVAGSQDELEERIDSMSRERDVALKGWSAAEAARDDAAAQRDRAESERDTAIADRIIADSDAWVALGKPGGTHDTTCVQRLCERFAEVKGERDALLRSIKDAFMSLNIPHSTMAFDGRNLLPHAEESARYAEVMRAERDTLKAKLDANDNEWADQIAAALQSATDKTGRTPSMMAGRVQREREELGATKAKLAAVEDERDKALADVAKYADRSESLASSIDHLVSNTADSTDLARIAKERDDFRDGMVAMLVAAGAPADLDGMEEAVSKAGDKPSDFVKQRIRVLTEERDALWTAHRDVVDERDALKAKLADPRRVLIHETEVVATKEEIATLKARLADLSEADEELHTCRALVNATSENLSVDLEHMVDDLAEANEKAARSEKDSHSWHELYQDTKAKLAACEAERDAQATELVDERDRAKAKLAAAESAHSELFLSGQVAELRGKLAAVVAAYDHVFGDFDHSALSVDARILFDAIAAARGGAQ